MSTTIYLRVAKHDSTTPSAVNVEEGGETIAELFGGRKDGILRLTQSGGSAVWVNGDAIAYWVEHGEPKVHSL